MLFRVFIFLLVVFPMAGWCHIPLQALPADPRAWGHELPPFHPARKVLDQIFSQPGRVLADAKSLQKVGGFVLLKQGYSLCYVARHPQMPGFLIKVYPDASDHTDVLGAWLRRIEGATRVREAIARHHLEQRFAVPKKWIYPVPTTGHLPEHGLRKDYILVVEDMDIHTDHGNQTLWMSSAVDETLLNGLYILLSEVGLFDSVYIDNIPFNREGKVCFIDTEHSGGWPVAYHKITTWLRPSMKRHWREIAQ